MELIYIILIAVIGLSLIVVEVLVIPGSSIVGFIGFGITVGTIYMAYRFHGSQAGTIVLGGSVVISGGFLYYAIKYKVWERFSLNKEIDGHVSSNVNEKISVGLEGIAVSALKPYGKAEFDDETYEVVTHGSFVDVGTLIRIVKVESEKIFVQPINNN